MVHHGQAHNSIKHHASATAAEIAGAQPGGKHMAVHARQLAIQPGLQIIRRDCGNMLRSMEQADRSTGEDHVHWIAQMGTWVLINAL